MTLPQPFTNGVVSNMSATFAERWHANAGTESVRCKTMPAILRESALRRRAHSRRVDATSVDVITADDLAVDFLSLDVEGAELAVLQATNLSAVKVKPSRTATVPLDPDGHVVSYASSPPPFVCVARACQSVSDIAPDT